MTGHVATRRGQPLVFTGLLLSLWIGARLVLWESPWPISPMPDMFRLAPAMAGTDTRSSNAPSLAFRGKVTRYVRVTPGHYRVAKVKSRSVEGFAPHTRMQVLPVIAPSVQNLSPAAPPRPSTSAMDFERSLAVLVPRTGRPSPAVRWRADAWAFFRGGSATVATSPNAPSYGASQAGAIIAYRLSPQSAHNPELYARGSKALVENGEIDVAAGVRVTPLPALPVRIHAEIRATRFDSETEVRPSAFVTAGVEETDLIADVGVRAYAQAGYVGGRYATGFVDGHALAEKRVADLGPARLGVGAGVWGGAQKGAERLDVGPTVSALIDVGGAPVRLSADYRIRVAGSAAPGDGVAITLATGF